MRKRKPLQIITDKVDSMSLRERAILMGVAFMCITLACIQFGLDPLMKETAQRKSNIQAKTSKKNEVENELKILKIEYSIDPNESLYKEKAHLVKSITKADQELDALMYSLVTPQKMVSVIKDLFTTGDDIALLSLTTLEPMSVIYITSGNENETEANSSETSNANSNSGTLNDENIQVQELFRHGIEVRFEANFHTTLSYLETLEDLKWRFYWHNLNYEVQEFPTAIVTLEIHTFSRDPGVLGV